MPIKPVSGPKCMKHQMESIYNCGWCSKPICEGCVEAAQGKKYCDKCWTKKQQMTPAAAPAGKPVGPRTPVKNLDNTLDPKAAEEQRKARELNAKKFLNQ